MDAVLSSGPSVAEALSPFFADEYVVFPGFCDVHVHFREPGFSYKETIETGSKASAAGGYTAVCTMPNLSPVPDSVEHLREQLKLIEEESAIHVYPYGAITVAQQGEVLADLEAILNASGMEPLDMFAISDVPKDEYFAMTLGLSGGDGIINGTSCGPVMSATAFSCVIVTLEDEGKIYDVQKDFAANVDWNKWVCVSADAAMIARKGNMVLCLVGSAELYQKTANAVMASGWTTMETLER
jgi:hypothetical protein